MLLLCCWSNLLLPRQLDVAGGFDVVFAPYRLSPRGIVLELPVLLRDYLDVLCLLGQRFVPAQDRLVGLRPLRIDHRIAVLLAALRGIPVYMLRIQQQKFKITDGQGPLFQDLAKLLYILILEDVIVQVQTVLTQGPMRRV